jgi:hypothetical protein
MADQRFRPGPVFGRCRVKWLAVAAFLGVIRFVAPYMPVGSNGGGMLYDLGQAHAVCVSPIGQIGAALSGQIAQRCGLVTDAYDVLNVVVIAAVACLILALVSVGLPNGSAER